MPCCAARNPAWGVRGGNGGGRRGVEGEAQPARMGLHGAQRAARPRFADTPKGTTGGARTATHPDVGTSRTGGDNPPVDGRVGSEIP